MTPEPTPGGPSAPTDLLIATAERIAADGPSGAALRLARRRAWFATGAGILLFVSGIVAVLLARDRSAGTDESPPSTDPATPSSTTAPSTTVGSSTSSVLDAPVGTAPAVPATAATTTPTTTTPTTTTPTKTTVPAETTRSSSDSTVLTETASASNGLDW